MRLIEPESLDIRILEKAPLFLLPGWLRYQEDQSVRCYLYQDEDGIFIPFRVYRRWIFKTGQFLYKPWHPEYTLNPQQEKEALERFFHFIQRNQVCDIVRAPIHVCLFDAIPAKAKSWEMGIISVDLTRDEEAVFASFSKTYRTQIRQCEKLGYEISLDSKYLSDFFDNYKLHHQRQGKTFEPLSHIQKLLELMPNNAKLFSVLNASGLWEGGVVLIYDTYRGYYLLGAKNEKADLHQGSQKFLHYRIMQFLRTKHIPRYNLGGLHIIESADTKFSALQNFKLKFGAEVEQGILFDKIINYKHHVYQFLIRAKSILK